MVRTNFRFVFLFGNQYGLLKKNKNKIEVVRSNFRLIQSKILDRFVLIIILQFESVRKELQIPTCHHYHQILLDEGTIQSIKDIT